MVGGVGMRGAWCAVSRWTASLVTGPRNGKSASLRSGNSSRNGRGFTTAPERAGPPPTRATSVSIRAPAPGARSCRMSRSGGNGCWYRAGRNRSPLPAPSAMQLLYLFGEPGYYLEQVPDDSVVRDLEDRRVLVLVDRDDHLGRAHP